MDRCHEKRHCPGYVVGKSYCIIQVPVRSNESHASEAEAIGQGDSPVGAIASVPEGSGETESGASEVIAKKPAPAVEKTPAQMMADLLSGGREAKLPSAKDGPVENSGDFSPMEFNHTRDGHAIFVAKINRPLNAEEYSAAKATAKGNESNLIEQWLANAAKAVHRRP